MKILHWKRLLLDPTEEGKPSTVWQLVSEPSFDRAALEAQFAQLPAKAQGDAADATSAKPKVETYESNLPSMEAAFRVWRWSCSFG